MQKEGIERAKRRKAQELIDTRKINDDLHCTRLVDPAHTLGQRQAASMPRTSASGVHARFESQLMLRDREFLNQ